jgi:hypothetical protein
MSSRSNTLVAKGASVEDVHAQIPKQRSIARTSVKPLLLTLVSFFVLFNISKGNTMLLTPLVVIVVWALTLCFCHGVNGSTNKNHGQKFDAIIEQVAQKIHEEEGKGGETVSSLEDPLLSSAQQQPSPPGHRVFNVEDRQFSITDKKSGEVFLQGANSPSVLRLSFAPSASGCRILGVRSTMVSPHQNYDIEKGYLSLATRRAYWVESCQGIRRVVNAQFSQENDFRSFSGEWLGSDGSRGSLVSINQELSVDYAIPLEERKVRGRGVNDEPLLESTNGNV